MRVLAVDFGTSNTVAALGVDGGAPRLVTIDGSPLVPSSVYLTDDGTLAVGRDADRQARLDPSRYEPNPKRRIDDGSVLLGATAMPVPTVIAQVLTRVAGEVRRQLGGEPDQVRLTHPARWGQRRRDTLLAAAAEAGLRAPVLIPEPVAAATHFATLAGAGGLPDGRALAVYDLGGGTFDIAVVGRRGGGYEVLAEAGLPDLGGLDFDHAITGHIGATHAGELDPAAWQRLLQPTDAASRRQARVLATDVRDGKEALSRYPHVDIALPPPFPDVHLTRAEFEDLIRPNLQRSVDLMARTIADAGLAPGQLAGVYLVGGSSRIPLVARLIQQSLAVTPTTLDQPETSVVTGALYLPLGAQAPAAAGPVAPQPGGPAGGYPTMPPFQPGYPSGAQPAAYPPSGLVTGPPTPPGLPAPTRPAAAPYGPPRLPGPAPHPAAPPRPGPAVAPRRRTGRLVGAAVALVVVGTLTTVGILYGTRHHPPAPGPVASNSQTTTASGSSPADQCFTDDTVRAYVQPTLGEMQSCQRGFSLGNTTAGQAVPAATTITYTNGLQVAFAKANQDQIDVFRDYISRMMPTAHLAVHQGNWSGGHVDEYPATTGGEVNGLYWDDRDTNIYAFALIGADRMSVSKIRDWWQQRFEH